MEGANAASAISSRMTWRGSSSRCSPDPPPGLGAAKAAKKAEEAAKKAAESESGETREGGRKAGVRAARPLKKKKGKRAGGPLFR